MKQYVIDQLRESDYYQIMDYLNESATQTALEGIYWVNIPRELYTPMQVQHTQCHPFYFAISLDRNQLSCEWLIRSRQTMRCSCIAYASPEQRDFIIKFADDILEKLGIKL